MNTPPPLPPPFPQPPQPHRRQAVQEGSEEHSSGAGKRAGLAAAVVTAISGITIALINKCEHLPVVSTVTAKDKRSEMLAGVWTCHLENPVMRFDYRVTLYKAGTMSGYFEGMDQFGNFVQGQTAGEWKIEEDEFVGRMNTSTQPQLISLGPFAQKIDSLTSSSFVVRDTSTGMIYSYRRAD